MSWPCAGCGGENPEGTRFCGHCGTPRGDGGTATATAAPDLQATVADVAEAISTALSGDRGAGEVVNRPLVERLASARGAVEERRLITAVFADVSGFTALAHGLDAEQLVAIIGPIVSRLADIVTRYGGYVGKFAGDAILAFFGAPVAHEDDAVRALFAALDMQREAAELFRSLGPEAASLTLHVGVNTGYVVAGHFGDEVRMEYSVLGDAVNVAQRLESAAPGGAVYVGRDTYLLARSRFLFEDLGGIQVKGKPEPVAAWRLVDAVAEGAAASPLGGRLVGRTRELETLTAVLTPVAGAGGVAALVGEPGRGKSALIHEVRRRSTADGVDWIEAHCVPYRSRPYRPYVELLRIAAEAPEDLDPQAAAARIVDLAAAAGVPETAPFFLRMLGLPALPGMAADSAPTDPMAFRQGLHDAFTAYLVARASRRPLVVGIEDIHWADPGTADLTRHLVARSRQAAYSLVLTARPEGRDAAAALVGGAAQPILLDLGPLDAAAVAELAADVLGGPADASLSALVAERTSGNPLFAQQLLRSLVETEALERRPGGWRLARGWSADAVPTGVEQVLAARIDVLPRPAADLLQVASVLGRNVLPALLRRVAGDAAHHDEALRLLVHGGLLDPVDDGGETQLWFHHALLVDVAYARLLRARRREIHRAAVEAVTELYGTGDDVVDMLARHARGGEMGGLAVDYLERAGTRAQALFANEQAVEYLRQAIEIAGQDVALQPRLPALLLRCAQVEETRGAYPEALELYRRAEEADEGVSAAVGQVSTLRKMGEYAAGKELLLRTWAAHPALSPEDEARVCLEEGQLLAVSGELQRGVDCFERGRAAIAGLGHPLLEARLLIHQARAEQGLDLLAAALAHGEEARRLCEAAGDPSLLATILRVHGAQQAQAADPELAERGRANLERGLELARRVGNAEEAAAALVNLAVALGDQGRYDEAMRHDAEAVEAFASVGLKAGVACGYCNLAEHLQGAGHHAEALEAAQRGVAVGEEIGNPFWTSGGLIGISGSRLALGDPAGALQAAEAALDVAVDAAQRGRIESALRAGVAAARALGDEEAERRVRARAGGVAAAADS